MLKTKPERMTYAQEKLIALIESRKLRRWCIDNDLNHSAVYRLAMGEQLPTYKIISSMSHLIAPIEWLFYTDEQLPYEPQPVPKWDSTQPCKFVKEHKFEYKTIAAKYGMQELSAYNIFIAYRAKPTPELIRKACADVNPTEFFTDGDSELKPPKDYVPERGDIVSVGGKIVLALTKAETNGARKTFTGCAIVAECDGGIALQGTQTKGFVNPYSLHSFAIGHTSPRTMIEKAGCDVTERAIETVRSLFG